ncbi:MAG: HlyD family efflux transporter periplasmic adaptor subunit [Verrucomicrobia bacterium]|nr:HlyD family efflux transporter periplasmic adaptor subunit [Verrucomicrobiota bacterium]
MALKPRTIALIGFGAVALAGLVFVTFRTEPIAVDLQPVISGPMQITINADGKTRIREVYDVAAPITGTTRRSPVDVGDRVIGGETVVAVVDPAAPDLLDSRSRMQAEAAVQEAEAALNVAKSQEDQAVEDLSYAQSQMDRTQTLLTRGVVSITRLEDATQFLAVKRAAKDSASSRTAMAEGALTRAKAALIEPGDNAAQIDEQCCLQLRAPVTGSVLHVYVVSESPIAAGTVLVSIGQPDDLEIIADLLSTDAVRLAPGAPASVERWGGADPLVARLRSIEPSAYTKVSALGIEEQRVDAVFDLLSPPEDRRALGNGFSVFLRIVEWRDEAVVQVPLSALFRLHNGWAVFVAQGGFAHLTPVTVGAKNGETAQILDGVIPGDPVITHPSDQIADGVAIIDRAEM